MRCNALENSLCNSPVLPTHKNMAYPEVSLGVAAKISVQGKSDTITLFLKLNHMRQRVSNMASMATKALQLP